MKKPKRITSHHVAKAAGVSRTTVSFVLNNVKGINISDATRQRVLGAVAELSYVPDAAARTLSSGQTRTLGLIIHDPQHLQIDAFINHVLYSLIEVSRQHGFRVMVEAVEDVSPDNVYQSLVKAKQIDGLVVINPRSDDQQLPALIDAGFPVVLIGKIRHQQAYSIFHRSSAEGVVAHLIALGHRRIAHITYAPTPYVSSSDRLRGYKRALIQANLPLDEALVCYGNYSAESGYRAMQSLLDSKRRPSAAFAGNDTIAIGAMAAIHEQKLRIPEDIAVVGYDDIPLAAFTTPPLTTVRTPALEQGRLAGEMLIGLVRGDEPVSRQIALETQLVIRRSCGAQHSET